MKKLLLILLLFISLIAVDRSEIISMIKKNPALLDSAQGQIMLRQYGMTKSQVIEIIKNDDVKKNDGTYKKEIKNELAFAEDKNETMEMEQLKEQIKKKLLSEYEKIIDTELGAKIAKENEEKLKELIKEKPIIHPFAYKTSKELIDELKEKQINQKKSELKRFSEGFFNNRNQKDITSLPVPEWYKVSVNDQFLITLFGVKNETYTLRVKADGSVIIPSFGTLKVAGKSFKSASQTIKKAFVNTFTNTEVVVDIDQYSSMQIVITGEVKAPGIYNLSSLSTLKDALISANGISDIGSVRQIEIKRDGKVIKKVDLYDFIISGDMTESEYLQANDVVHVPVAKTLVRVLGEVKRPAIYELKSEQSVSDLLIYCGGVTAKANTQNISITRYEKNQKKQKLNITIQKSKDTKLYDMDELYIYPIDEKNVHGVYVYGNVLNPGFWELPLKVESVGELFKEKAKNQNGIENVFLPDTHMEYMTIKRFDDKLSYKMISVNLQKELNGKTITKLNDKDELYIFDKRIMSGSPYVEISGDPVANPGKYMYYDGMSVADIIIAAGINSGSIIDKENMKVGTRAVNLNNFPHFQLKPFDDVIVYDENVTKPKNFAHVYGEVYSPGEYDINENTTLEDLINMSGGLTEKAALNKIEITHYFIKNNIREKELISYDGDVKNLYPLNIRKYDEVRIFRIPKWGDRQTITLKGEVNYPGEYVVYKGEKLFNVIERAGGFSKGAFIEGAIFSRESLKEAQQKELKNSLFRLKQNITAKSLSATDFGGQAGQTGQTVQLINDLERQAEEYAPQGRIALELNRDILKNKQSPNNILLENKDMLYVPSIQSTVTVIGEVLSQSTIIYQKNISVEDYIALAGGLKETANEDAIFIIHANGMTEKADKGWFSSSAKIRQGDTIFIPPTIDTFSNLAAAKDISGVIYQLAISAASLKAIGAL